VAAISGNLRSIGFTVCALLAFFVVGPGIALGQRVILSEDFESDTPGTLPISSDFYARSCSPFVNCATDPSKIVVTGGAFADPFGPGNQSLLLHNPNSGAQMAITWTSAFEDDPATFRNGVVEFDVWMDKPLPVLGQPGGKYWSFLDIRTGFGGADRSGVSTVGDFTVWNNIRIQNSSQPEPVESVVDAGGRDTLGFETTYTDPVPDGLMGPDRSFHVRLELTGTPGNESFVTKVDGTPVTWLQDGEMSHPWGPGAPGVNVLSFLSDTSSILTGGGAGNVYLDNLVVINNDLPPLPALNGDYNDNGTVDAADYVLWRDNVGTSVVLPNDPLGGPIGQAHYNQWRANFGATAGSGSAVLAAGVPEPTSIVLLASTVATICGWAARMRRSAL
jgi:hypothetical protein